MILTNSIAQFFRNAKCIGFDASVLRTEPWNEISKVEKFKPTLQVF